MEVDVGKPQKEVQIVDVSRFCSVDGRTQLLGQDLLKGIGRHRPIDSVAEARKDRLGTYRGNHCLRESEINLEIAAAKACLQWPNEVNIGGKAAVTPLDAPRRQIELEAFTSGKSCQGFLQRRENAIRIDRPNDGEVQILRVR